MAVRRIRLVKDTLTELAPADLGRVAVGASGTTCVQTIVREVTTALTTQCVTLLGSCGR